MTIPQIHDRLFRNVFGDRREAAALLRPHLPPPLADGLNWSTLTLLNRSYIDDDARASELDLLFTIERSADAAPLALYVLLEHQSEPNRYMRLRLLKYCCRIWEQAEQEVGRLRAIVPVVLYQGRRRWPWPTELSELFAPVERQWPWAPRFAHLLIDQSQAAGEQVGSGTRGRIALLALMAAYRQGREQLQLALRVVRLLAALPPTGRFDIVKLFVTYLLQTQDEAHLPRLSEEWRRRAPEAGGDFVTIAEMLIKQGRQEGRQEGLQEGLQEGRLETLEQLVRSGVEWPLIEAAAGSDPATLRALKERLASEQTNGHADGADQSEPPR
jgi:predicted transposase/invertase (TIGR01784 family)